MNGLKLIRTICNYSQAALAEKLGVTRQAVNMWEHSRKPIPENRRSEICRFFGVEMEEWLGEIDEKTADEIRKSRVFREVGDSSEHYKFSPTEDMAGKIGIRFECEDDISLDERCELYRIKFKELLADIQNYAEEQKRGMKNSMFRISRMNTASRIFGDIFAAVKSCSAKNPAMIMPHIYSIFAAIDGINIAFGNFSEEEYLNSADPSGKAYDTRELTLRISKLIAGYLDSAEKEITEMKGR